MILRKGELLKKTYKKCVQYLVPLPYHKNIDLSTFLEISGIDTKSGGLLLWD